MTYLLRLFFLLSQRSGQNRLVREVPSVKVPFDGTLATWHLHGRSYVSFAKTQPSQRYVRRHWSAARLQSGGPQVYSTYIYIRYDMMPQDCYY